MHFDINGEPTSSKGIWYSTFDICKVIDQTNLPPDSPQYHWAVCRFDRW